MQHVGSSSLTRGQTLAPCSGSAESYPLDHEGSPRTQILYCNVINIELHLCQTIAVHWVLNAPNCPPFVAEALEFELMDCWSFLEFTPRSSMTPLAWLFQLCSNSLREGTSLSE